MKSPLLVLPTLALATSAVAQITISFDVVGTLSRVPANAFPGISVGDPVAFSFTTDLAPDVPVPSAFSSTPDAVSGMTFGIGPVEALSVFGVSPSGTMEMLNATGNEALCLDFSNSVLSNAVSGYEVVTFKMLFLNAGFTEPGTLIEPNVPTADAFDLARWVVRGGSVAFQNPSDNYFSVDYTISSLSMSELGTIPESSAVGFLFGLPALLFALRRRR